MSTKEMVDILKDLVSRKLMIVVDGYKYEVGTDKKIYLFDDRENGNLSKNIEHNIFELKKFLALNDQWIVEFTDLEKSLEWDLDKRIEMMKKNKKKWKIIAEKSKREE